MDSARTDSLATDQAAGLRALAGNEQERWQRPIGGHDSCRVIAISGGKGGVGKTNVSVNLGLALAEAGARVLLFDADLGLANVDIVLGVSPRVTLDNVLRREAELQQAVYEAAFGLHYLPGGRGINLLASAGTLEVVRLLGQLRGLEKSHDFIILDTAAGCAESVLRFLQSSDDIVLVTTPEPTALLDAYGLLKALGGIRQGQGLSLLVNMVRGSDEVGTTHRGLAEATKKFLGVDLKLLGAIPRDGAVEEAVRSRIPLLLSSPNSPAAQQLRLIAAGYLADSFFQSAAAADSYFARLLSTLR
jgi:flagellar biosynthesis protein FlhG